MALYPTLTSAAPHDRLVQTGGAIGWGLPAAVGAAIAAPNRKVLCIDGDDLALRGTDGQPMGSRAIAAHLNRLGHKLRCGPFRHSNVDGILK